MINMLVDKDSKPQETILYLSAQILSKIKEYRRIDIGALNTIFQDIDSTQPSYKFYLSLNFLYLMDKVKIEKGELVYVS